MSKLYFIVGSQDLYGEECLKQVAADAKEMVDFLGEKLKDTVEIELLPTVETSELCVKDIRTAENDDDCVGVITWMHTFSPAKMWIKGLQILRKPLLHLHTQYNEKLPYDSIDMDFMNLNQAAHGDLEYGFSLAKLQVPHEVVAGYYRHEHVVEKIRRFVPNVKRNDSIVSDLMAKVKELESAGYQFEGADGSFELLVRKMLGQYKPFFKLHYYQTTGSNPRPEEGVCCCAQIKVEVDGNFEITAGEGDGPVNALDIALRKALEKFYPVVSNFRLVDYKVRVLDSKSATAARVRVIIESTDGQSSWTTVGVSSDVIEASWIALVDSFELKLSK